MPYIDKYKRDSLNELMRMYKQYPSWKNPAESAEIMGMINTWLEIITRENNVSKARDGYLNYMCTRMIKHTHRTYCMKGGKQIFNKFDKEVAKFVRDLFYESFERRPSPAYFYYERLYGLLSLMEAEFERRGWSLGRPDIKEFFKSEKKYWLKRIAEYEDEKILSNGDLD